MNLSDASIAHKGFFATHFSNVSGQDNRTMIGLKKLS